MTEQLTQLFAAFALVVLVLFFSTTAQADQAQHIQVGTQYYPADCTELTLSGISPDALEAVLPLFPSLQKVILSDTSADSATLDAINRKHPDISVVWTVMIGKIPVRTDAISFYTYGTGYQPREDDLQELRYCSEMIAVDVGHLQISDCSWLEGMPHLKYLILADTKITDITPVSNLKELVYLELFNLKLKDYSPLLGCTALQDLNISDTHADPEPLSRMTWLHNLHWYRCFSDPDTRDAVARLPEQLPHTNVMLEEVGVISGIWRSLPNYYVFRDLIGGDFLNQSSIQKNWGEADSKKILSCSHSDSFAGEVLADIVKYRMDNGVPIIGVKDAQCALTLYESLLDSIAYKDR